MNMPLNITEMSQQQPRGYRQAVLRALPTRAWLVDAGLEMAVNPRWESLWAGISLTVASPHQPVHAPIGIAEAHDLDNVIRLAVPKRGTDSGSKSEAPISVSDSTGRLHQVEFGNQGPLIPRILGRFGADS